MDQIREVTVFSVGDSRKISTWSNIPFFFTETLIDKRIKVNRVDLSPSRYLNKIYNVIFWRILRFFNKKTTYVYFRSLIHFMDVRYRIKKADRKYNNSQINIFLTFSFSSFGLTQKPSVLFCDWTYDHYFNYFENRKPDIFEKGSIKREDKQIEGANLIFLLFSGVADYMKKRYVNKNIFYLGNVINSLYNVSDVQLLGKKSTSKSLLFIGDLKYLEGAKSLIKAFEVLKNEYLDLILNIVGLNESDFNYLPDGVTCYGYLDKEKDNERNLYYLLLQNARVFVNTTPKWGGFSATIEAMYFYNPVIVTCYSEFVETFGREINFGFYCEENSVDMLCNNIKKILEDESYNALCINAHESVKDFTWSAYIDKLLEVVKEKIE